MKGEWKGTQHDERVRYAVVKRGHEARIQNHKGQRTKVMIVHGLATFYRLSVTSPIAGSIAFELSSKPSVF